MLFTISIALETDLLKRTSLRSVGSNSCQTPRCVNPEPTEPASKLGFHPILNLSSRVVFRGSLSRRCICQHFLFSNLLVSLYFFIRVSIVLSLPFFVSFCLVSVTFFAQKCSLKCRFNNQLNVVRYCC